MIVLEVGEDECRAAPGGLPLWVAEVEPGSVHDLTAARAHVLGALYAAAATGLPTLADNGYDGAGIGIHTPITCNRLLRPSGIGGIARAALVLTHFEYDYLPAIR